MTDRDDVPTLDEALRSGLRRVRTDYRLTLDDVAAAARAFGVEMTRQAIGNIEGGSRKVGTVEFLKLVDVLNRAVLVSGHYEQVTKDHPFPIQMADMLGPEVRITESDPPTPTSGPDALVGRRPLVVPDDLVGDLEESLAAVYSLPVNVVLAVATERYGRSLTAERSHRPAHLRTRPKEWDFAWTVTDELGDELAELSQALNGADLESLRALSRDKKEKDQ